LSAEGTLTVSIAAGALTDSFGNPGQAFSGSYTLDFGTVAFPTPLTAKPPLGSLIYDPSASGIIGPAGDTDSFTVNVDAGQTISVLVTPGATLRPTVTLTPPSGPSVRITATAAANKALLQTISTAGGRSFPTSFGG